MDSKKREKFIQKILFSFKVNPVVALLGPRQCGKTTLTRMFIEQQEIAEKVHYFDLEDPEDLALFENPKLTLGSLEGLIVLDEIQKVPEIFPLIRVLVDDPKSKKKFLILGSASRELVHQSSETLAGRISHLELTPFCYGEVEDLDRLWIQGGFPKAYLSGSLKESVLWRKEFISTFLERDIPALGFKIPSQAMRRFWMMLSAFHGNIFNASEIGRSLGLSSVSMRKYLDLLVGTFMVRELQPWHENINKRQVKSPKIYFRDSGIFHSLLGALSREEILRHVKLGASWEGFALESVIRSLNVDSEDCYFWAVHQQAELDLLVFKEGKRLGFEFKWADAPKATSSIIAACDTLHLDSCTVIYPGKKDYFLKDSIRVIGLNNFLKERLACDV